MFTWNCFDIKSVRQEFQELSDQIKRTPYTISLLVQDDCRHFPKGLERHKQFSKRFGKNAVCSASCVRFARICDYYGLQHQVENPIAMTIFSLCKIKFVRTSSESERSAGTSITPKNEA